MLPAPTTRTMQHWLGVTMRVSREDQDIKRSEIAGRLRISEATVIRFESGRSWPTHVDQYLAAYAELLGVSDPREFWTNAVDRWFEDGEMPRVEPADDPIDLAMEAARQAAQPDTPAPDGASRRNHAAKAKRPVAP